MDTSGSNGSGAIVQSKTNTVSTGTSLTVTLDSGITQTNNATFGGFRKAGQGNAVTPGSGFTELGEATDSTDGRIESEYKAVGANTTVDASWSDTINALGIAVEVKNAIVPTTPGGMLAFF